MIHLSVALVTRNRPQSLDRCLSSLRAQDAQPFEVLISDDSNEEYAAQVRDIALKWDCRYIVGPRRGLYANRNHVAQHCQGTHIRTMDDDHTFPAGHIRQCLRAIELDSCAIWTTGEHGFLDGKRISTTGVANQLHPSGVGISAENLDNNWAIADGSTIYPCMVFQQGFKMLENYKYGEAYLEFGALLYHRGFISRCITDCYVEHHVNTDTLARSLASSTDYANSVLYALAAYNLYFKPNQLLAVQYLVSFLKNANQNRWLILHLPSLLTRVKERWTGYRGNEER